MLLAIIAVLIASQSATHTAEVQKMKRDRIKTRQSEDVEKAKLKKQESIRDLSSGSENIR